jgi:hypothetical protein
MGEMSLMRMNVLHEVLKLCTLQLLAVPIYVQNSIYEYCPLLEN